MEGGLGAKAGIMLVFVALCGAAPTVAPSQEELSKAQEYLSQFFSEVGVSAPNSVWRSSLDSFEDALKKMQQFFGLAATGQLDAQTLEVMNRPRCGFTDVSRYGHFDGRPKWGKTLVTYRVIDYTPDLSPRDVDATLAKALKLYSDVIPLDFKKIDSGIADIMITFKPLDHGDFSPFDGQGGVLAHAFSPGEGMGGDTHFDEDETWSLTSKGTNLLLVAAHELGHALGLAHSQIPGALMFPTYHYVSTDGYKLPDDDRQGVQAIYGVRATSGQPTTKPDPNPQPTQKPGPVPNPRPQPNPQPTQKPGPVPNPKPQPNPQPTQKPGSVPNPRPQPNPQPTSEPTPDRCNSNLVFDAVTSIQKHLYFFKDGYYWRRRSSWEGITVSKIQSTWPGIKKIDAAYEIANRNKVIFFQGAHYWEIKGNTVSPGYPKPLTDLGFPASVTKVDAAVYVSFISRVLLFVNNKYWSYNDRTGRMDAGYPKMIETELPGIGNRVDAAFENKGLLYFSNGPSQTEYSYQLRRAHRTLSNSAWMDCIHKP